MGLKLIYFVLFSSLIIISNARLTIEDGYKKTFDSELYESVLDPLLCERQLLYMYFTNPALFLQFVDAGFRLPRGVFGGNIVDLGNYFQCLDIKEDLFDMNVEGKYCLVNIPLDQSLEIPALPEFPEFPFPIPNITDSDYIHYSPDMASQSFNYGQQPFYLRRNQNKQDNGDGGMDILDIASLQLAVCIPKVCTVQQWVQFALVNVTIFGFDYAEEFCRLPNDKPMVAADYVAIIVFGLLGVLTILSTCYDINHTIIQKKDPKKANILGRTFSVYTNTRRLLTFTKNTNTLDCLDGIRSISMIWVILGHTYSAYNFIGNLRETVDWITSPGAVWVTTALFSVDSFFTVAGLLLVYTSVGKLTGKRFIRSLHSFYINRLLRMFPLLAAIVLLEATLIHHVADGPYWVNVATNVQQCRQFWWSTLIHVQNYANPRDLCIQHSWYIAIDIQLHIISPLVLYWCLNNNNRSAWISLTSAILLIMTGATIFNFFMDLPSTNMTISRLSEQDHYMTMFYLNTLTRGSPFFIGMMYGYILSLWRGKRIKLNTVVVLIGWALSLAIIGLSFYTSAVIMDLEWNNQVGDNLFNSFMRAAWALALGWLILACVKGYGGPINWFLSLEMWRVPARISYAMYLFHYPIQFVVTGMLLQPTYFSVDTKFFEFMGMLMISFLIAFTATVLIDAPFSILIKMLMEAGGGGKRPRPQETVRKSLPGNGSSPALENGSLKKKVSISKPDTDDDPRRTSESGSITKKDSVAVVSKI